QALIGLALVAIVGAVPSSHSEVAPEPVVLRIDPNTAPLAVLETLPRIGPMMGGRIVEARPFADLDDLDRRVRGIGPATRSALAPHLRFDSERSPASRDR
ncbi:MAG TPA: helix-hairpin-helix domain-containing protein, partial [Isosphaeraceae bacterium]